MTCRGVCGEGGLHKTDMFGAAAAVQCDITHLFDGQQLEALAILVLVRQVYPHTRMSLFSVCLNQSGSGCSGLSAVYSRWTADK